MNFELPKIYPITDQYISGISHAEQVRRLIRGGARIVQLRDKSATSAEFYEAAVRSVTIAREHGVPVIINDRVDIAKAAGAAGVHLGQDDLPANEARKILGEKAIIGLSTHSVEQADRARKMPVDYIAIGPIFATATKESPDPVVGIGKLPTIRQLIGPLKFVAIGGITRGNILEVLENGADSAAIISDIVQEADQIEQKMRLFASLCATRR